jgi:hypothetical protein
MHHSNGHLENSGTASDDISHENDIIKNLMNNTQVTNYYEK